MVTKTDFVPLAEHVIPALGGPENIRSVTHCATRLRFAIRDAEKVNKHAVENAPDVVTLVVAGGQHQVVVGNEVPLAYQAVIAQPHMQIKGIKGDTDPVDTDGSTTELDDDDSGKKNPVNAFMDLISALFSPIVWCLAGLGLGKAFLTLFTTLGVLSESSDTYRVFNAAFDGFFYFLPLFLAVTAARKFKADIFIAMATVAPLVYPAIVEIGSRNDVHFLGIPLKTATYTSSVLAPIVAVWIAAYLQHWLERILPGAIRNFFTPLLVVGIMVPLTLLTIGPAMTWLSEAIADGVNGVFRVAPWLGGAIMGAFWQVLVIFGLHSAFQPIFLNELAVDGRIVMAAPLMAAVLAQAAAAAAVWVRSKNSARRKVAGAGTISGFLAGVTEPIIYGVNLPLKYPFYAGCVGGAIGGAIIAQGKNALSTYVFPSLLALPATTSIGSFAAQLIGSGTAIVIAFVTSWFLVPYAEKKFDQTVATPAHETQPASQELAAQPTHADVHEAEPTEHPGPMVSPVASAERSTADIATSAAVVSPIEGTVVDLKNVPDKVFASGAMGTGVGIRPSSGVITSPIEGTVIAAPRSGHAYGIRSASGIEILIHIGVDTVRMNGEGFTTSVSRGDHVTTGQPLGTADLGAIAQSGYDDTTVVVVTNSRKLADVSLDVSPGRSVSHDVLFTVTP